MTDLTREQIIKATRLLADNRLDGAHGMLSVIRCDRLTGYGPAIADIRVQAAQAQQARDTYRQALTDYLAAVTRAYFAGEAGASDE